MNLSLEIHGAIMSTFCHQLFAPESPRLAALGRGLGLETTLPKDVILS